MPEIELKDLLEKQNKAFAEFRDANDKRLKSLEDRGSVDTLLEEKVDRANAEITRLSKLLGELEAKAKRPRSLGDPGLSEEAAEHKQAFNGFVRKGVDDGLLDLERKALNITTGSDGGYAVPEQVDTEILNLMQNMSPMRSVCRVVTVGTSDYKKLVNTHGTGSGWVGSGVPSVCDTSNTGTSRNRRRASRRCSPGCCPGGRCSWSSSTFV